MLAVNALSRERCTVKKVGQPGKLFRKTIAKPEAT